MKDSDLSSKSSIRRELQVLSLKAAILSLVIVASLLFVTLLIQVRTAVQNDIVNFLVFGRDNIITLERELGYDQFVGYDYAVEHLYNKFQLRSISFSRTFNYKTCWLAKKYVVNNDEVTACFLGFENFLLLKTLNTIKGEQLLIVDKDFPILSDSAVYYSYLMLSAIALFFVLFLWFERQSKKLSFDSFYGIYDYLKHGNYPVSKDSYLETTTIYDAIKHHSLALAATILAHDINKPFSLLETTFSNLKDTGNFKKASQYLDNKMPHVEKCFQVVKTMASDIVNLEKGVDIFKKPLLLSELVEESLHVFACSKLDVNIELGYSGEILGDKAMLYSVLINILNNAEKHARGGKVWITSTVNKNYVQVTIANEGKTLPEKNIEELFDLYKTSGNSSGRGIGLAAARLYIEAHGGKIWAKNLVQQKMSEFSFTLPLG